MKKVLSFIMVLLPFALCAQVRVITPPNSVETEVEYDSISNFPYGQITGIVGQKLFLRYKPEELQKYGYSNFKRADGKKKSDVPYKEISGHTFIVKSIDSSEKMFNYYSFRLEDIKTGKEYIFKDLCSKYTWPFIILGYKEKYEDKHKGEAFVSLYYKEKEYNTGKYIEVRGTSWIFQEIIAIENSLNMGYLYNNERGETIVVEDVRNDRMIPKKEIDECIRLYGRKMYEASIKGEIMIGMPQRLVVIAKGNPRNINRASYGEQWVYGEYGGDCIYFKDGLVTGWN